MTRRLAAIMFTDLVGFTRLGQQDEAAALRLRREHQSLLRPIFARFGGREVKSLGDGFLVEFASAVEAVECAVEVQRAIGRRNESAPGEYRFQLRVGLHSGDVVEEEGDVLGDAVNVASRIEPLAEPGGICLSAAIYEQVRNKLPIRFESEGVRTLKNVQEPVEIFRVVDDGSGASPPPRPPPAPPSFRLAVLPLVNLSAEPEDEFFADGLTDELISRTAQIPQVRVIARTSVRRYKDSSKSIREVGRELDVGVALEGSIRKSGNRIRIAVQLVDARSEAHLWSTRYDRPIDDIFAIQDDIAGQVAASVAPFLVGTAPGARAPPPAPAPAHETSDMEAYSLFLHGRQVFGEKGSVESIRTALTLFEGAVTRDPRFARARVGVAETLMWLATEGSVPFFQAEDRAVQEIRAALAINDGIAEAHSVLAAFYLSRDRFAEVELEARRAMELNPSLADPYRWLAQLAAGRGDIREAIRLLDIARRLNPDDVNVLSFFGRALFYAGDEAEALAFWDATQSQVRFRTNAHRSEYYLAKGDLVRAEASIREMERIRANSPWTLVYRGLLAVRQGNDALARQAIERLKERAKNGEMVTFFIGFLQFGLGETDEFIASMEDAFRDGTLPLLELLYSPLYERARGDPRLQDILRRQRERHSVAPTPSAG